MDQYAVDTGLLAGASRLSIPGNLLARSYRVVVTTDADDNVLETPFEDNNSATSAGTITIAANPAPQPQQLRPEDAFGLTNTEAGD